MAAEQGEQTSQPAPHHPDAPPVWALATAFAGGVVGAAQSRINAELGTALADGFAAGLTSFTVGLIVVTAVIAARPRLRRRTADLLTDLARGRVPWLYAFGAIGGVAYVLGQSLVVALTGVALFLVCVVAGQTISGMVLDRVGFGPSGPRTVSLNRLGGAALMLVAAAISVSGGFTGGIHVLPLLAPIAAGLLMGYQAAANGQVTAHAGHFLVATHWNFLLGTVLLAAAAIVNIVVNGPPTVPPADPLLFTGGVLGIAVVGVSAALVQHLGVLTFSMTLVAGQIIGSLLLDAVLHPSALTLPTVLSAALTLVAAVLTAGMRPRRRPSPRSVRFSALDRD